jgi:hypothetical protein
MADKVLSNPAGAFGYTAKQDKLYQQIAPFKAQSAITGPAVVAINTTGNVATVATDGTAATCVGICINSPAAGEIAQVVIAGVVDSVPVAGTISAGQMLIRSVTTAGRVNSSTAPAAGEALGMAIADGSGANGTVSVWVKFFG